MNSAPNRADLAAYLDMIFGYVEGDGFCIALRGVGEKNTPKEGAPPDVVILPADGDMLADKIFGHVQRWGQHDFASFIVPGAVDGLALADKHATEDRMRLLTTLLVDIDKGDTAERLAWAQAGLGQASMIVHSGGTTETGHPKIHAYWRLSEPSDQVAAIAAARKMLALKVGGDTSFGRSTQVVRLPGSVYNKGHAGKACKIEHITKYEYDLGDLLEAIDSMPPAPGLEIDQQKLLPAPSPASYSTGSGLNFSGFKASGSGEKPSKSDIGAVLTTDIHEGGDEERNRWNEFGRVAGMRIADARLGRISLDAAKADALAWMETHMKPAWPAVRFETEWKSLVALDIRHKGAMPGRALEAAVDPIQPISGAILRAPADLAMWDIDKWTLDFPPPVKFLVPGLIAEGVQHLLVAAGGAGKTFLLLDLAMKIAAKQPGDGLRWLDMPLPDDSAGTAIVLTMEDDKHSLHRRIHKLDPEKKLRGVPGMGARCKIIPALNAGGAFPLVEREKGSGVAVVGHRWEEWLRHILAVPDLKLVVIDTLNSTMHGDENNATIINEYMQAAAVQICGEKGATLIVTHHVRKPGANTKIYTPEDFLHEIRGSGALAGAFRLVLGIWQVPDYKARMSRLGLAPAEGQFFSYGVVKTNIEDTIYPATRAALRQRTGMLGDITGLDIAANQSARAIAEEWLVKAVEICARDHHPLTKTSPTTGVFARRMVLPEALKTVPKHTLQKMVDDLIERRDLVLCDPHGGKNLAYLDVPDGNLAKGVGQDGGAYHIEDGAWNPPEWERHYAWDPIHLKVVGVDERHPATR